MTKQEFLNTLAKLYRVGNRGDVSRSEKPAEESWTNAAMAGPACCAALDGMLNKMVESGAITAEEHQTLLDTL